MPTSAAGEEVLPGLRSLPSLLGGSLLQSRCSRATRGGGGWVPLLDEGVAGLSHHFPRDGSFSGRRRGDCPLPDGSYGLRHTTPAHLLLQRRCCQPSLSRPRGLFSASGDNYVPARGVGQQRDRERDRPYQCHPVS